MNDEHDNAADDKEMLRGHEPSWYGPEDPGLDYGLRKATSGLRHLLGPEPYDRQEENDWDPKWWVNALIEERTYVASKQLDYLDGFV